MSKNTMMFEVGIKRAEGEYQKIYDEVMELAKKGEKGIDLKVNFQASKELETFVNALRMVGDGKLLEPLLNKIEQLQVSMVRLGMIPKDINYSALEEQLNKITNAYKNYQNAMTKNGEKSAVTTQFYNAWQSQIARLRNDFGMSEQMARSVMDTYNNMGRTIASNLERVGGSKAGMETLAGEVAGVKSHVDALVKSFSQFVEQLNQLGSNKGAKTVGEDLANMDKQSAKTLASQLEKLVAQKELVVSGESSLEKETRSATNALASEEIQAKSTTIALKDAANTIQAVALAVKNMYTIMGGNSGAVTQFLELANQMDFLSRKAQYILGADSSQFSGGKVSAFGEVKKEMEAVQAQMEELKKSASVGNPLVESVGQSFTALVTALNAAGTSIAETSGKLGTLDTALSKVQNNTKKALVDPQDANAGIQATQRNAQSLQQEGQAATITKSEMEALVSAKKQVTEAEQQQSRVNDHNTQTLQQEGTQAKQTAKQVQELGHAEKQAADAAQQEANTLDGLTMKYGTLRQRAENWQANLSKLLESGQSNYFPKQIQEAIAGYQRLIEIIESVKKGEKFNLGGKEFFMEFDRNTLSVLSAYMRNLGVEFANVNKEAKAFNKTQEQNAKQQQKISEKAAKDAQRNAKIEAESKNAALVKYNELGAKLNELYALRRRGYEANIDVSDISNYISYLERVRNLMNEIRNNKGRTPDSQLVRDFKISSGMLAGDVLKENNVINGKYFGKNELAQYKKELADAENRMKAAGKTAENLGKHIDNLEAKRVDFKGLDTTRFDAAIQRVREIKHELESFASTGLSNFGKSSNEIIHNMGLAAANKEVKDSLAQLGSEAKAAAPAINKLTEEEQKLAQAIGVSSKEVKKQSQVLSDLKSMATQYLSIWGAQTFVDNIIKIGGQLEQQRLSIGAILGDMAAGQHLFEQIKSLALTSPFGVMELDKDTKQLAAYGFKQSELFDMTKRLADISAGAGTEVSRLALALGHVRSEGALSGYTLRQFAMNNIPMLGKLSERLTEIEGKIVSTQEIRKRISKKEIGYEDVIAVIKDLTNEGGMFYNMQETMSEAVNAKFKNLRDSFDIMYSEIAESKVGDALKAIAETLMVLSRNWESTSRFLGYGAVAWLAYKVAVMGANTGITKFSMESSRSVMMLNAKKIALGLNSAAVKKLTADEVNEMVTLKLLTKEQLVSAVATGRLRFSQAELAAETLNVSRAQLFAAASMGRYGLLMSGLGLRLRSLIISIRGIGVALKSAFLNPVGIAMIGLSAMFEWYMRWKQHNDEMKESISGLEKKSSEGYRNLSETLNKFSKVGKMDETGYVSAIGDIVDALKNYAPDVNNILKQAYAIDDLGKRYEYLRDELEKTKQAYANLEKVAGSAVYAAENSDLPDQIEDYIEALKKQTKAESEFYQNRASIEKALDRLGGNYAGFNKARRNDDGSLKTIEQQMQLIRGNGGWSKLFSTYLYTESQKAASAWNEFNGKLSESEQIMRNNVEPAIKDFADRINNDYIGKFGKDWKKDTSNVKTAWMEIVEQIDKVPGMTDKVKNELLDKIFNERWKLNIDFSTGETTETLVGWRKEMQDYFDEHDILLKIGVNDKPEDIEKRLKGIKDDAQSAVDRYGKVLIGIGFKLDNLPSSLPAPLATPWNQNALDNYPTQKAIVDSAVEAAKKFNFDLSGKNKNKGSGSKEDKDLKKARTHLEEVKSFLSEYKKYYPVYGRERSISLLESLFPTTAGEGSTIIDKYTDLIQKILNKVDKSTEERKKFHLQGKKLITDTFFERDKEALDRQMKEMEEYMSERIERYNLYKSILEKTGDKDFANKAFENGQVWDDAANHLADKLREKMGDKATLLDWDADKQSAEDWFKKNFQNGEALYKMWEKIVDLIRGNYKNALTSAADSMKEAMTYEEQKEAIRAKYTERNKTALTDKDRYANQKAEAEELAKVDLSRLKDEINWDAVFGNLGRYTKKTLVETRKSIQDFVKLNRQNMSIEELKNTADAVNKLNEVIADKSGLFGGLSDSMKEYIKAVEELTTAEKKYQDAVKNYGENSIQAQDARKKRNQAQQQVDNAGAFVQDTSEKTMNKLSTIAQSLVSVGKKEGASMSEVGSTIGTLIDVLGKTNTGIGTLVAAIFSIADSIGNNPQGFFDNMGKSLGNAIWGINDRLNLSNNINKTIDRWAGDDYPVRKFMIGVESLEWMKGPDTQEYDDMLKSYENLISVWDQLISKKKEYISEKWGTESANAGKEILRLLQSEVEVAKTLAKERLASGSSTWTRSYGRRMWEDEWSAVSKEISKSLNVPFNDMYDMVDMSAEQLQWIMEHYPELWAKMNTEFRGHLEDIIKYGDEVKDTLDSIDEKLSGLSFSGLVDSYYNFVTAGEDANDVLANDLESKLKEAIVKGMIENLYQDRINALLEKATNLGKNDTYIDTNGNVRKHTYDANGNIIDKNVASEYTGDEYRVLTDIANKIGEDSDNTYKILKELYGWSDDESSSSSMSNNIKGVTEQTADLVASYLNAIRADVSVNRAMIAQYYPMFYSAMTSGNASLRNLEQQARITAQNTEAIKNNTADVLSLISGLRSRTWSIPIA